jgi:hypothetical protein
VTHVSKCSAHPSRLLAIVEEGPKFGLGGGRHDNFQKGTRNMDGSIFWGWWIVGIDVGGVDGATRAEKKVTSCTASGVRLRLVGGVGVHVQDHVTGMVLQRGIRIGSGIIQELGGGQSCVVRGLCGCESTQCNKHGAIDSPCIVQECTNYLLEP